MIITTLKDTNEILSNLDKKDKIAIISCDNCAKVCGTGGEKGAEEMLNIVEKSGYEVTDMFLYGPLCDKDLDNHLRDLKGNVALILGCEAGEYTFKKFSNFDKIILCLNSKGIGAFDEDKKPFVVRSL